MKIEGFSHLQKNHKAKSLKKKSDSSSLFSSMIEDESENSLGESEPISLSSLNTLDSLSFINQIVEKDPQEQKSLMQGHKLLDYLEQLHQDLVLGEIDITHLENISKLSKVHIDQGVNPKLKNILQQIELRAEVELAKLKYMKHS